MLLKTKQKLEQQVRNSIQIEVNDIHSKRKDTMNKKVQEEKESVTDAHKYKEKGYLHVTFKHQGTSRR